MAFDSHVRSHPTKRTRSHRTRAGNHDRILKSTSRKFPSLKWDDSAPGVFGWLGKGRIRDHGKQLGDSARWRPGAFEEMWRHLAAVVQVVAVGEPSA